MKSASSRLCQRAFRGEVLCFTPKNAKKGRFSHGFEIPQSGIMEVRVKRASKAQQRRLFCVIDLCKLK